MYIYVCVCVCKVWMALNELPVSPGTVPLSPYGWRSTAQVSAPSTCQSEPWVLFLLPILFLLLLHAPSSCLMSACAVSLQNSLFPPSSVAPSCSLPALQPVGNRFWCDFSRATRESWLISPWVTKMPRVLSDKTTHITVGIVSRRSQTLNILLRDPVIQLHHASHTVHASDLKKKQNTHL